MAARTACCFFLLLPAAIIIGLHSRLCAADGSILYSGDRLDGGQELKYRNYELKMQTDCNFVLYDSGTAIWASGTSQQGTNCYVIMQADGNLVIYSGTNQPLWASNTDQGGQGNYVLILQSDRNVVIYGRALWATGTNVHGTGVVVDVTRRNETSSPLGSVAVVVNNKGPGEGLDLGRKISMVTTKEI